MKKTLIALGAAVVVLLLLLFQGRKQYESETADRFAFDSTVASAADGLKVKSAAGTAALVKTGEGWAVSGGPKPEWPADSGKAQSLLRSVFRLQNREVVSTRKDRLGEYGLDSAGAKEVTVSQGADKILARVLIGKASTADYNSTFWKYPDQDEVYRTPGNFSWDIPARDLDWRAKSLGGMPAGEIRRIEVVWADSLKLNHSFAAERKGGTARDTGKSAGAGWTLVSEKEAPAQEAPLKAMADRIAEMALDDFVNPGDTALAQVDTTTPTLTLRAVSQGGKDWNLKAFGRVGEMLFCKHPALPRWIKISTWRFDVFKKKPAELQLPTAPADSLAGAIPPPSPAPASPMPAPAPGNP